MFQYILAVLPHNCKNKFRIIFFKMFIAQQVKQVIYRLVVENILLIRVLLDIFLFGSGSEDDRPTPFQQCVI